MNRGDVFDARLDPVEGSEQGGSRPVVVVSRDAINASSPVIVAGKLYPSHVLVKAPDGGLKAHSVALPEQIRAIDKTRLRLRRGGLSADALQALDQALAIMLDLPFR